MAYSELQQSNTSKYAKKGHFCTFLALWTPKTLIGQAAGTLAPFPWTMRIFWYIGRPWFLMYLIVREVESHTLSILFDLYVFSRVEKAQEIIFFKNLASA